MTCEVPCPAAPLLQPPTPTPCVQRRPSNASLPHLSPVLAVDALFQAFCEGAERNPDWSGECGLGGVCKATSMVA